MQLSNLIFLCSAGETFDSVARFVYGDEKYAAELMNANPALCGNFSFRGGEKLRLPVVVLPTAEGATIADVAPWKTTTKEG